MSAFVNPMALATSLPLACSFRCLARFASECDFRYGKIMRPIDSVSIHNFGRIPKQCVRMKPSNRVLWQHTAEFSQS